MQSKAIFITIISLTLLFTSNSQSLTTSCYSGQYYSSSTGQCQQCDISCAQCTSSDGCSLCYDQMYLTPVGNKVLCGYCYDILAGCTVCSSAYKCASCSNGYFLMPNSSCATCSNLTPNCALCFQNSTSSELYCLACTDPYVLVNGLCIGNATASKIQTSLNSIANGASAGSNNQVNPSTLVKNNTQQDQQSSQSPQTQPQTQSQSQPQPQTQSQPQTQAQTTSSQSISSQAITVQSTPAPSQNISCGIEFILVNSVCTRIIPYCAQYNNATQKCDICASSYSLSNGYCIPSILLMNSQASQSTQTVQTQTSSTPNINQNSPNTPQTPSNSNSNACPVGQYLWYGSCVVPGTQCTNRDANNQCTNCIIGYTLTNGLCIQQMPSSTSTNSVSNSIYNSSNSNNNGGILGNGASGVNGAIVTNGGNIGNSGNNSTFIVMTVLNQTLEVVSSGCTSPCVTCKNGDSKYCVTCISGMTIVDAFPGVCFKIN